MFKLLLKNQIHVLVSICGADQIESVELSPYADGFGYQMNGNPSKKLVQQIDSFFEGYLNKKEAPLPPLAWDRIQTLFTKKILNFLKDLPFGKILTYKEIALAVGSPKGSRAVGGACGRNPFPFFIPCHRVLSQSGLGGFSCGLEIKKSLLFFEKI